MTPGPMASTPDDALSKLEAIVGDMELISAMLNTCCDDTRKLFAPLMAEIVRELREAQLRIQR